VKIGEGRRDALHGGARRRVQRHWITYPQTRLAGSSWCNHLMNGVSTMHAGRDRA